MLELDFHPFPELITQRLLLRRIVKEDAAEIYFLRSDEEVLRYIGKEPAQTIEEAENFIQQINHGIDANEHIMWAITLLDEPRQLIGTIGIWQIRKEHFRAEIGYVLHPLFWRRGIMKEAILKVLEYGFETMHLHSIQAQVAAENIASAAVLEAAGFVREAYFREDFFFRGKFFDTIVFSKLKDK
jgi:ribosomal-protein-alanine N-acetyltransferase